MLNSTLKPLLEQHGITLKEFAVMTNTKVSTLYYWDKSRTPGIVKAYLQLHEELKRVNKKLLNNCEDHQYEYRGILPFVAYMGSDPKTQKWVEERSNKSNSKLLDSYKIFDDEYLKKRKEK